MKVTVDTNFLISSMIWDNSVAHKLLLKLISNDVDIYTTKEILEEFSKVLKRDFKYSDKGVVERIDNVVSFVKLVITKNKINIVKGDPDDNKIIECAFESDSKYIITYDKHLLKIKEYKGINIIKPEEFLGYF
tara:strand:+ start:11944 stop:12342 length:399 start_codon:yes stop_codon:yes gene_type:complete